jgi:hypothetical protein
MEQSNSVKRPPVKVKKVQPTKKLTDIDLLQQETQKMDERLQQLRQMLSSSKSQWEDVSKKNGGSIWSSARPVTKNYKDLVMEEVAKKEPLFDMSYSKTTNANKSSSQLSTVSASDVTKNQTQQSIQRAPQRQYVAPSPKVTTLQQPQRSAQKCTTSFGSQTSSESIQSSMSDTILMTKNASDQVSDDSIQVEEGQAGCLLNGEYDESESKSWFQQAREEWLNLAPTSSDGTTQHKVIIVREQDKCDEGTTADMDLCGVRSGAFDDNNIQSSIGSNSLLEGAMQPYDEAAAAREFQEARNAWLESIGMKPQSITYAPSGTAGTASNLNGSTDTHAKSNSNVNGSRTTNENSANGMRSLNSDDDGNWNVYTSQGRPFPGQKPQEETRACYQCYKLFFLDKGIFLKEFGKYFCCKSCMEVFQGNRKITCSAKGCHRAVLHKDAVLKGLAPFCSGRCADGDVTNSSSFMLQQGTNIILKHATSSISTSNASVANVLHMTNNHSAANASSQTKESTAADDGDAVASSLSMLQLGSNTSNRPLDYYVTKDDDDDNDDDDQEHDDDDDDDGGGADDHDSHANEFRVGSSKPSERDAEPIMVVDEPDDEFD